MALFSFIAGAVFALVIRTSISAMADQDARTLILRWARTLELAALISSWGACRRHTLIQSSGCHGGGFQDQGCLMSSPIGEPADGIPSLQTTR